MIRWILLSWQKYGCKGISYNQDRGSRRVLKEAISLNQPVVIDCVIDCDEKVWPMVAPGAAIQDVFSEEDLES